MFDLLGEGHESKAAARGVIKMSEAGAGDKAKAAAAAATARRRRARAGDGEKAEAGAGDNPKVGKKKMMLLLAELMKRIMC